MLSVSAVGRAGNARAVVQLADGSQQTVTLGEEAERHWDHAYVSTVHSAQGATCRDVIVNLATSNRELVGHEAWYVEISRAKQGVTIFTDDVERLPQAIAASMAKDSALDAYEKRQKELLSRSGGGRVPVEPWVREAVAALREGRGLEAFAACRGRGLVHGHAQDWQALETVYERWKQALERNGAAEALMMACSRKEVATLNALARDELRYRGLLGADSELVTAYGTRNLAAGDRVTFFQDQSDGHTKSGQTGVVQSIEGSRMTVDVGGRTVTLQSATDLKIDYAYAVTARRATCIEADDVYVLTSRYFDREACAQAIGSHRRSLELHWSRNTLVLSPILLEFSGSARPSGNRRRPVRDLVGAMWDRPGANRTRGTASGDRADAIV